ncbi:MAG: aminodeoxychorismate lyase [Bacteroidetes bacterium]|nr:MAG: aminodeoxychorismate lyase [Bacteroidota bacterium]
MKWRGWERRIKAGKYTLNVGESVGDVAEKFAIGDRGAVKVVVPAGRDLGVIAGKISSKIAADSVEVFGLITRDSIRWRIIPNTYEMWWETDANGAVDRLLKENAKWWNEERLAKAEKIGLSTKEVVILASIVQAETSQKSEAPIVAGLYLNRLKRGQPLQADPTLIYAAGDASIRRVLSVHKEIDSPYNTYKYAGLPPGPIRVPEPTYLLAVLDAEEHDYLYMCAEPGGTGRHSFARRYVEHKRNARRYQKWLDNQHIYR